MSVGTELLAVPFPQMVRQLGVGIAEAQYELDKVSMKIARMMAGYDETKELKADGTPNTDPDAPFKSQEFRIKLGDGNAYSLIELGFTPTFYQFVDTVIELKMSISVKSSSEANSSATNVAAGVKGSVGFLSASASVHASSVSASYASKYQYSAEGSSLMRTKLVPLPPPALFEERIKAIIAASADGKAPTP
jgi:hypothetical protein